MDNKKFKLTSETKIAFGRKLYRIEAKISFGTVSKGDKGGWIEKEDNISADGNAWVSGNAMVFDDARVYGDAKVFGNAWVFDDAKVFGDAEISGDAKVFSNAKVYGDAKVFGNAKVYGDAKAYGYTKKSPINVMSPYRNVTITDRHIKIGCKFKTTEEWRKTTVEQVEEMEGEKAAQVWKILKSSIIKIAEFHQGGNND